MLKAGEIIKNTYQVIEPIGEGGAGQVFLAWHINLQKNVVIKRIKDDYVGRINERGEADILKKLHHQFLPQVYDFVQMGNEVYTVIDYIDGNTLMDYIEAGVRFDEVQIIRWLMQLCEALDYLHTQNPPIIHSDIKPSNIMVDTAGDICLIDFNISFDESDMKKISGYTAGYASPEQVRKVQLYSTGGNYIDVHLDARSDIFSLGASMYHAMTLQNPIKTMSDNEGLWRTDISMPYSELLINIIEKSMKRNPKDRYQTAALMLRDLETMKVRDKRYRRLNRNQAVFNIAFVLLFVAGLLLIARGTVLRNAEEFDAEYERIVGEASSDDYDTTINDIISLLNDGKYTAILDDRKREKADLLFIVANAYFENDDYDNAIPFYEKAIDNDKSNPEYYRDYAIANARIGKNDEALSILDDGMKRGLEGADLYLVQAEIESSQGNLDAAINDFKEAIHTAPDEYTLGRAMFLCARAYRSQGELYMARDTLEDAYNYASDEWKLRALREEGAVAIQYIDENGEDYDWLNVAEECFEKLVNSGRYTFNDRMNLALVKELKGDDDEARALLDSIKAEYPDEYRVPLRQAMFELESQSAVEESKRNYEKAVKYYNEAEALYEKYRNSGESDNEMQYLEKLIKELEDKGWIDLGD